MSAGKEDKDYLKWIALIVIGMIIIFFISKSIYTNYKKKQDNKDKTYETPNNQPGSATYDPTKPTIGNQLASDLANQIYDAINFWGFTKVDGNKIAATIKQINNDADFLLVKNAFGLKSFHDSMWPLGTDDLGLADALQKILALEQSTDVLNSLNDYFKSKGMTTRI
jgi:hypothetical protein